MSTLGLTPAGALMFVGAGLYLAGYVLKYVTGDSLFMKVTEIHVTPVSHEPKVPKEKEEEVEVKQERIIEL